MRDLGRFPREGEADESEAGEKAGDNAAPEYSVKFPYFRCLTFIIFQTDLLQNHWFRLLPGNGLTAS